MSGDCNRVVNQSRYGYRFAFNPVHTLDKPFNKIARFFNKILYQFKAKAFFPNRRERHKASGVQAG